MSDYKISIFASRYILGKGAIAELPAFLARFGGKGFFLVCEPLAETIRPYVGAGTMMIFEEECCEEELERIQKRAGAADATVILGIGGGKIIDASKITAVRMKLPIVIVPTIAATNACSTCGTVVYTRDGVYVKSIYSPANPNVVLVDSQIIVNAPSRYFIAGIADALPTYYEALTCKKGNHNNIPGGKQTLLPLAAAKLCLDTLHTYARQAVADAKEHRVTPAVENILEAITNLSSIGYENTGVAGAHAIQYGLTALPQTHHLLHGEKVAFGTIASLFMNEDIGAEEIDQVHDLCRDLGLPTTFADLNLPDISEEDLQKIAVATCATAYACKEKGGADPQAFVTAMKKADALGQARRNR